MKKSYLLKSVTAVAILLSANFSFAETVKLDSHQQPRLSLESVAKVARDNAKVEIAPEYWQQIDKGHQVILQAAINQVPVYGLTVGVGWNKDKPVFSEKEGKKQVSSELLDLSRKFNLSSLRAHAAGLGEPLPIDVVRAGMLIRLNTMLEGNTGVQKAVVEQYLAFLNHGITPVVPSRGTVGEADITLASHIGLAMAGEWDVFYQGVRRPAKEVLTELKLSPLNPVGKDFLSILSTNSLMAGKATLLALDTESLYRKQIALFAFTLEAYNGNVAPFSEQATQARPFKGQLHSAKLIREKLKGSDLWNISENRSLQDPLSFRSMAYTLGNLDEQLVGLRENLLIAINHTDDNPTVFLQEEKQESLQLQKYAIDNNGQRGAIYPTANFNFLPVTTRIEGVNQALAKVAEVLTQQLIRLENPEFTKLSRFLSAPDNQGHAFGAIQKPFVETNIRIKQWASPASFQSATLAGNIEDTATMSGIALDNLQNIIDGIYEIDAFQLLHSAQAIDLRKDFKLGASSQNIWQAYRTLVPFIEQDTAYTPIIEKGISFWKNYEVVNQ